MEYFDAHAHYDDNKFDEDRDSLLQEIFKSGVTKIVSAGYSVKGSKAGIELCEKYDFIYTTIGLSPNDISENVEQDIKTIEKLLEKEKYNKKIVAVGEIGLDYYYEKNKEIQKRIFIYQINLANKYNKPIVIHTREAVMDTINILKENNVIKKGIFHCCPHNRELVKEALKLGFYISFGGTSTFKNARNAKEIFNMVPLNKFVTETDSPYLSPEPNRGKRNDSRNLKFIIKKLAEYKNISEEEIAKYACENAKKIYEIK